MLTLKRIAEFENSYKKSMDSVWYWEKQLVKPQQHDEWMSTVYKRSQAMHTIYLENQKQFTELFAELEEDMSYEVREKLYDMLLELFFANGYDDAILMNHIVQKLMPYYEAVKDDSHIINLLQVQAFVSTEYFYRQNRYSEKFSYHTFHGKLYAYRTKYKELPLEEKRIIFANYHNMICTLPTLIPHELNYTLDIYDDFLNLIQDEEIIEINKTDEMLLFRQDSIQGGIWHVAVIIEHFDRTHLLHFYDLLKKEYEKGKRSSNQKIPDNVVAAYYYTSAYLKENLIMDTGIGWKEAYSYLFAIANRLLKELESMEFGTIHETFLWDIYYPYLETACLVFKIYQHRKEHDENQSMEEFVHRGTEIFKKFPKGEYPWMVYGNYSEWCEYALSVLSNQDEQEELIKSIIVKGQIQTYIHSQMVSLLANTILEQIIQHCPTLLLTLPCYETIMDVQKNAERLHDYLSHAALYHDIGKNRIAAVINQQIRKLSDEEFALIRQHPEHPETGVLKGTPNFVQYYDIIAGHHKSYDGKTGYPADFDNVHSPYRIMIDLITICDCLDASTDRLGRNYAGGKEFKEVLIELKQGSGTRYNPDIINLILENQSLKEELNDIVNNRRKEVYYQTYKEYFS